MMIWCFDIDGVINANPQALSWLTFHLNKNENSVRIIVLTWRDGSNQQRRNETVEELERWGIRYDELVMAPRRFENDRIAAFWKITQIDELGVNIWFDNDIKHYKRDYQIDLDVLLPTVEKINI